MTAAAAPTNKPSTPKATPVGWAWLGALLAIMLDTELATELGRPLVTDATMLLPGRVAVAVIELSSEDSEDRKDEASERRDDDMAEDSLADALAEMEEATEEAEEASEDATEETIDDAELPQRRFLTTELETELWAYTGEAAKHRATDREAALILNCISLSIVEIKMG
ncbi:hypothetical protein PC9H_008556 [Pleurotus ostreatus]|uniref:Uncharacterized protein n=1 Tax=Pleurotus ostreatus TaxID=5322 RepID=A0A8H6ZRV3_PLEOS|nr:uncharacterized protein PC9H_008556 [Pleurotus ostreatus]KAF7426189.1 hypothetical protein PC9H_008556 [Pleurotus ostreatus]